MTVRLEPPPLPRSTDPSATAEAAAKRHRSGEYWTLERATPGTASGICVRCGAPLVLDRRGRCRSCRATLDLGRSTWVLARHESAHDWWSRIIEPGLPGALQELDAIAAADPTFDPDVFVARVTTLYPALARAAWEPSCPLALVAIAPLLRRQLAAARGSPGSAVPTGLVESLVVQRAEITAARHLSGRGDGITVEVMAEVVEHEGDAAGHASGRGAERRTVHDLWTFWRPAGVTSTAHGGALAELCPVCGAPIELDAEGQCRHCNADVTLGTRDWTLFAAWTTIERIRAASGRASTGCGDG